MFEDVLIESAKQKGRGRKALSLPVSLALHLVVIGLAVGASIWFVEDVPEPPIPVTFYAAAPASAGGWSRRSARRPPIST
jgi:hypothetical protein